MRASVGSRVVEGRNRFALIATPVARDRAIARLQDHYAQNHIDVETFESLVMRAERATLDSEFEALFRGLPALESALVPAAAHGRVTHTMTATFGSNQRRGRWSVPKQLVVRARFGEIEIDFSEAVLAPGETVVDVGVLFGSVRLIVPEGLAVVCDGRALFGSFDHASLDALSSKDARRVRIVGRVWFGSFEIVVKPRPSALARIGAGIRGLLGG
jgi:hypothetical protein